MPDAAQAQENEAKPDASDANADISLAIDRIRELAKWLVVLLGGVAGVLIGGSKLSDLGSTQGWKIWLAIGCAVIALAGVGIAIAFTIAVLMPKRMDLSRLVAEGDKSTAGKLLAKKPDALSGRASKLEDLRCERECAERRYAEAKPLEKAKPEDAAAKEKLEEAEAELDEIEEAVYRFLGLTRLEEVKVAMGRARIALLGGGAVVALAIGGYAWATHSDDNPTSATTAEAVPKQPSSVDVELSLHGTEVLAQRLGAGCPTKPLQAVALGGEPTALDVVSVPVAPCKTVRFTLTPDLGTPVNKEKVKTEAQTAKPK